MRGQIRVLHVDDDRGFLRLTAKLLAEQNDRFHIVSKSRVSDAISHLDDAETEIDCVVSDYAIPRTNGIEFLETVRAEHPELPFILFTGRGSESVASEALTNGATDYLQKQSGSEQYELLANRVQNAVEQYWSKLEHETSERYRQELYRITTDPSLSLEAKTRKLLELGCDRLGVENGHIVEIDREVGRHAIRTAAGSDFVQPDTVTELDETYCRETITSGSIMTVYDAAEEGWGDDEAYQRWEIGCYIGGRIEVGKELYGTVCFVNSQPRERPFSETERTFVDLVTRWLNQALERQAYEQELQGYEALLRTLPIGYARMTPAGELLAANSSFIDLVDGECKEDVLNRDVEELYGEPVAHERFTERLRDAETVTSHETMLETLTDTTIPVSLTGRLVERGGTEYVDTLVQEQAEATEGE